jgi:hypothetical protein
MFHIKCIGTHAYNICICIIHEIGRACNTNEKSNAYRILVGKQEGTRKLGRPRRRGANNIKMDLGWYGLD